MDALQVVALCLGLAGVALLVVGLVVIRHEKTPTEHRRRLVRWLVPVWVIIVIAGFVVLVLARDHHDTHGSGTSAVALLLPLLVVFGAVMVLLVTARRLPAERRPRALLVGAVAGLVAVGLMALLEGLR